MPYQKPPAPNNSSTGTLLLLRTILVKTAACFAVALLASGPAFLLIFENVGSVLWASTVLAGFVVACTAYRRWWPELGESRQLLLCFAMLLLYLMMPVLSYFLVDSSEFALKRVKRQFLFLGTPFVFLLFWWLRRRLRTVLAFIALNAVALGAYAFWFRESHPGRVDGVTHAVLFGNVSLFLSFASLALIFVTRRLGWRILAFAGVFLGGSASVLSGARGGWAGVPILIVIALIATVRALRLKRNMIVILTGFIVLTLVGLWQTKAVQTRITYMHHELTQLSKNNWRNSIGLRISMWEQAWMEIREAPILGTGFSGYRNRIHAAVEAGDLPEVMLKFATEPHNEYLYQWMTRGAPGLIIFLMCLSLAGWYFFRLLLHDDASRVAVGHVGLCLITVVVVGGLTITVVDQRAVIRFLAWIAALLVYCAWLCGKERTAGKALGGR